MPNSTTTAAAANTTRREILSVLRTTRSALSFRRRLRRSKEKRARRSNTHESTASNFFGADHESTAMGRFLPEEEDDDDCEYERNHPPTDNDDSDDGKDFLDATRYGGDDGDGDGPDAVPTSILTYAPNPSATMTGTATFLSYGVQPLAPPAVSARRASMGGYYRPTYVSDCAVAADGGRTMNRRGTVPPMGTSVTAVKVGGYLSSTVDNLLVAGHDPAAAGLDIDTSNHNAIHDQDLHHQSIEAYTFPFDQPPASSSSSTASLRDDDDDDDDISNKERRRNFEAMRKAEATRNPRFL